MQAAGIRCWKWNHDERLYGDLFDELNQVVRIQDKIVVVLSRHSLASDSVAPVIEWALREETRRSRLAAAGQGAHAARVLFPIRMDNFLFEESEEGNPVWEHPRRADLMPRKIVDAVGWQRDIEKYQRAHDQLSRDLKSSAACY